MVRMDIAVADEIIPAFSRVVSRRKVNEEAKAQVEKLKEVIPRQQFAFKIQARALGRIISSESVSAYRKDVLMHGSKVVGGEMLAERKNFLKNRKKVKRDYSQTQK